MDYKGYTGIVEFDDEAEIFHGLFHRGGQVEVEADAKALAQLGVGVARANQSIPVALPRA